MRLRLFFFIAILFLAACKQEQTVVEEDFSYIHTILADIPVLPSPNIQHICVHPVLKFSNLNGSKEKRLPNTLEKTVNGAQILLLTEEEALKKVNDGVFSEHTLYYVFQQPNISEDKTQMEITVENWATPSKRGYSKYSYQLVKKDAQWQVEHKDLLVIQ